MGVDIREQYPEIVEILLVDRTLSTAKKTRYIIWANAEYIQYGSREYKETAQIRPELITGAMKDIIKPRVFKTIDVQKGRTKSKAEVFTPTWIVKKQNDEIDKHYSEDDLETYVNRTWLEITCGEAPYMVTRYDMETGISIPLTERVGFIDRKLQRINREIRDKAEWHRQVINAYKASYGFEWNGDSLLLARENALYTYCDYYVDKWSEEPLYSLLKEIAEIISYNIFQMDGLNYTVPLTEKRELVEAVQLSLFEDEEPEEQWIIKPGKRVKVMNWELNKMEYFDKGVKSRVR